MVQRTQTMLVYNIRFSQGSVATGLKCGGIGPIWFFHWRFDNNDNNKTTRNCCYLCSC